MSLIKLRPDGLRAVFGFGLLVVVVAVAAYMTHAADTGAKIVGRAPWTTSKITGSPEPPPRYKIVRAFPHIKLDHPLWMANNHTLKRLFVGEQRGVIYSFEDKPDARAELFIDLRTELKTLALLPKARGVDTFYALAFHPRFAENRYCYVCYTISMKDGSHSQEGSRVSRFTVTQTDPPRLDPASEVITLTFLEGGHNGADMHFGPDGMLYISTGDAAGPNPPDPLNTGQDISDLCSSVLRIDVDHQDEGKPYAVPKDNPFVSMKGARPEVWAYGFRNPYRMSFDGKTGNLYVGDVGWDLWEMVHRVEKGGNYGWSAKEGPQPLKEKIGPTPIIPPLIELPHTIACSVTGGRVYHGRRFPELDGAYIFGDWETRRLWAAHFDGDRVKEMPELTRPLVRVVAFGEDLQGELYFLDYDGGTIHTIERYDSQQQNSAFPTKLSDTGLFESVKENRPAPGVVPFVINARQWQDGASAVHWAAFPGDSHAMLYQHGKPIPGFVQWHNFRLHFPKDAVLVRTLSLEGRRIETQILHYDGLDWRGYSFAWRDDQEDADLVPVEGTEKTFRTGAGERTWSFHSRGQCLSCHNNQSEYAQAFLPVQLNRNGSDGRNQLITLSEMGLLARAERNDKPMPPFDEASAARERKLVDPFDPAAPLEARARAYLHANCGHCHMEHGGGTVSLRLHESTPTKQMQAISVRPTRGDFGLPDAQIIKPGQPTASTLYFRMAKFGRDRMPHLGADLPDEAGLKLIGDWIASLGEAARPADLPIEKSIVQPETALTVARKIGRGEISVAERARLLALAERLPPGPVRELFEGYLPQPDPSSRTLGHSPRPSRILNLQGDPVRGEKLFWSQTLNCGKCHRVGGQGVAVGPELTQIGRLRSRGDLLESILEPSRRIEPKYVAYVIHTVNGQTLGGVITKRDDKIIVLRDGDGKERTLSTEEAEEVKPSRVSLMPEGQLSGLTAQQAADLLQYLVEMK